jgi:hypothetical protein
MQASAPRQGRALSKARQGKERLLGKAPMQVKAHRNVKARHLGKSRQGT